MSVPSRKSASVSIRQLEHGTGLPLPSYQTRGSAGMDLVAAIGDGERMRIAPGLWAIVPTGIEIALPVGMEAQVRPRSGLAARHGVTVLNSPGTIDADYRGEIAVILINLGRTPFPVHRGDRIAQLIVSRVEKVRFVKARKLSTTARGAGGFGSTGTGSEKIKRATAASRDKAKKGNAVLKKPASRKASSGTRKKPKKP